MIKFVNLEVCQASSIRKFQTLKLKFKKLSLNIWFLQQCKRKHVLPNFTKIRTHNNSPSAAAAVRKAREFWLNAELHRTYQERDNVSKNLYFTYNIINSFLHPLQIDNLFTNTLELTYKFSNKLHSKLKRKLNTLILEQCHFNSYKTNLSFNFNFFQRTMNLSETNFTTDEINLLDKGINFSINNYSKKKLKTIIAQTDSILNIVSHKFNCNIDYNKFTNIFIKNCTHIVNGKERHILSSIQRKIKANNLILTKADKGNCLVIQDKTTYLKKTLA